MFRFANQSYFMGFVVLIILVIYFVVSYRLLDIKLRKAFGTKMPLFMMWP